MFLFLDQPIIAYTSINFLFRIVRLRPENRAPTINGRRSCLRRKLSAEELFYRPNARIAPLVQLLGFLSITEGNVQVCFPTGMGATSYTRCE